MDNSKNHIDGREFVKLLTANQRRIYSYIITLVPNFNDADDIMQDTTAMMWEKMNDFKSGTDFVAWGIRIAYFKILDYRKKIKRGRRIVFSDNHFENLAEKSLVENKQSSEFIQKLLECLKKLKSQDKHLINLRYSVGLSVKEISFRLNNSVRSIYYGLARIQGVLLDCIERHES